MRKEVKATLLPNGMWLYSMPGPGNVSGVGFRVGSIHDPADKRGMAHFAEHVLARSSRKYMDQEALDLMLLRYLGGPDDDFNIHTHRYSTFYGHQSLFRQHYMLKVLDVMASFVHPKTRILEEEGRKIESAAVNNECSLRGFDVMEMLLEDSLHEVMYTKNPARNRVDAHLEDLATITLEDIRKFVKRYYVPKNAFIQILGPPHGTARKIAEHYFRDWDVKTVPTLDYDNSDNLPKWEGVKSLELTRDIQQYHVAVGFPTGTYLTEDAEAIDLLEMILQHRLAGVLREGNKDYQKGAYRVPVEAHRSSIHGIFYARFATHSADFARYGEDAILAATQRLKSELVSKAEFNAVLFRTEDAYMDAFHNSPNMLSDMIIEATANGDPDLERLNSFRERLQKLNRKKLCEAANKYFTDSYARVVIKPLNPRV